MKMFSKKEKRNCAYRLFISRLKLISVFSNIPTGIGSHRLKVIFFSRLNKGLTQSLIRSTRMSLTENIDYFTETPFF